MIRTVKAVYPCCQRPVRFRALVSIPAESYDRRCRPCETTWFVQRRATVVKDGPLKDAIIDVLKWTDTSIRIFRQKYGT